MSSIRNLKFLLDENISHNLIRVLKAFSVDWKSIKRLDKTGIENGDLCHYIKANDFTLITNDKDFLQLWSQYEIKVILLSVHPATDQHINPRFQQLLQDFDQVLPVSFLLMLTESSIIIRE